MELFVFNGAFEVRKWVLGIGELERIPLASKVTTARRPLAGEDRNVLGNFQVARRLVAQDGSDCGVDQSWIGTPACLHVVGGPFVIPFLRDHGADQGRVVHDFGGLLKGVGYLQIGYRCFDSSSRTADRRVWMGVEGVELAWAAVHPEEDQGFWP